MADISIQRIKDATDQPIPLFHEIEKRIGEVRQRAFEFFDKRGRELGHDLADWIHAEHEVLGWPAAELAEKNGEYKLEMTLPGFSANQVEVTATPTEIVVHSAIKPETKAAEDHVLWTEFGPNDVYRQFRLPQPIDVAKTSAALDNGLLKIIATKMPPVTAKPIAIANS
ncbi:MAG TPA: Hsp20/alpha crystallin family protein [Acidobacteriaceae bacterium]|nr:Hsp20/alpha crystallin family protein [Acidobacteriaceae bacterium]